MAVKINATHLQELIERTKALLGASYAGLAAKIDRGTTDPHRLVVLIRRAETLADTLTTSGKAAIQPEDVVMITELATAMLLLEEASSMPEFQDDIAATKDYCHAMTLLGVKRFVKASTGHDLEIVGRANSQTPDLVVHHGVHSLALEIWAPESLRHPDGGRIDDGVARRTIENGFRRKNSQIAGRDSVLVIGGFGLGSDTINELMSESERRLNRRTRPHLLAVTLLATQTFTAFNEVDGETDITGWSIGYESRISHNPGYTGNAQLVEPPILPDSPVRKLTPIGDGKFRLGD